MLTPRTLSAIMAALDNGHYNPTVQGAGRYMCTVLGWRHGHGSIAQTECTESLSELQYMLGCADGYSTLINTVGEFANGSGFALTPDVREAAERVCLAYYRELAALYRADPKIIVCGATLLDAFCRAFDAEWSL